MKASNLQACIIGILLTLIGGGLKYYDISVPGYILITVGVVGIPIIFIWNYFTHKTMKPEPKTLFRDDFLSFEGWLNVEPGAVLLSDEMSHESATSLKKVGANDPAGGFKYIGKTLKRGLVFSGWIFRPSGGDGGPADRLVIEDLNGNGYGFGIRHEDKGVLLIIEKRRGGAFEKNLSWKNIKPSNNISLRDSWYHFSLQITRYDLLVLNLDYKNQRIGHMKTKDSEYTDFARIAVRGGYPYYVDGLKINSI